MVDCILHVLVYVVLFHRVSLTDFPRGHGKELGKHRDSDGHIDTMEGLPTPQDFWDKYASVRRPLLMKGVAKNFPSFRLWTDEYLAKNFGDLEVKLENKKEKGNTPIGYKGLGRDTIRSFLETYQSTDSYIVSQLPDPMSDDVLVLPFLTCGSYAERILEANLWLSSGGSKSMLHRDADNAINCLLNGTKDWILIDPEHEDMIPIAEGDRGYGGFAVLDVDKVNLIKYPQVINLPWQYANISAGDCLYLPYGYWHQVRSYGSKNLAVTVLFSRLKKFDNTGCESGKLNYLPLSESNMVWTYPGHGAQTLGNMDPFELRDNLIEWIDNTTNKFTINEVHNQLIQMEVLEGNDQDENRWQLARELMKILDPNNQGFVTKDMAAQMSLAQLKEFANILDPDPANTEEYEYVVFSTNQIRDLFIRAVNKERRTITWEDFVNLYEDDGGSPKVAAELFAVLEPNEDGFITEENLQKNMQKILKLFEKTYLHDDMSGEFYQNELQKDKEMMTDFTPKEDDAFHQTKSKDEL